MSDGVVTAVSVSATHTMTKPPAERDTSPLGPGDLPSGDAIASEFQRFLRQQGPDR